MSRRRPPSDRRLALAAELRMGGSTWEAVARRLRRSPETVRKWPLEYADRWRTAVFHAERRLAADAEGEAVLILRQLLRSDSDKIRWHAAKALLNLRVDLNRLDLRAAQSKGPPQATTRDAVVLLAHMLGCYTDEQLAQLVVDEFDRAGCPTPHAPAPPAAPQWPHHDDHHHR